MTTLLPVASITEDVQRLIFDAARIMLYPVLVGLLVCLVWVLIELGAFFYEVVQRFRFRDIDALEVSALRARKAFRAGKPRAAYRHLQENKQSLVVTRFLFELIRNYQTERLAAKPLKLLQDYEFYTVRRLERTRLLTRLGPVLGLMGALIPLAPALSGLASGEVASLSQNLQTSFSVAVIGLLIGGLGFVIGLVRDRMYSQDISDLEYLMEILEGNDLRLRSGRRRDRSGTWERDPAVSFTDVAESDPTDDGSESAERAAIDGMEAGQPSSGDARERSDGPLHATQATAQLQPSASFDDPTMSWYADDDPFAALGPVADAVDSLKSPEPASDEANTSLNEGNRGEST